MVLLGRACASPAPAAAAARGGGSPAAYAPGACQAFAPTGRSRGRTVFVDPGHGGPDPGVTGQSGSRAPVLESRTALAVAGQVASMLRADGYRVLLSRTGDTSVRRFDAADLDGGLMDAAQVRQDLQARVRCANDAGASALLSIHFNGFDDPTVGGSQTVYDSARSFAGQSRRLAQSLQSAMTARLHLADRGVLADDALDAPTLSDRADSYGHLMLLGPPLPGWLDQGTAMPGALVEPLFLTDPQEAALATSPGGQRRIAGALVAGLESYLAAPPAQQQ